MSTRPSVFFETTHTLKQSLATPSYVYQEATAASTLLLLLLLLCLGQRIVHNKYTSNVSRSAIDDYESRAYIIVA